MFKIFDILLAFETRVTQVQILWKIKLDLLLCLGIRAFKRVQLVKIRFRPPVKVGQG